MAANPGAVGYTEADSHPHESASAVPTESPFFDYRGLSDAPMTLMRSPRGAGRATHATPVVHDMLALAARAAVEVDSIPLHVGQNMARAVLKVAGLHAPLNAEPNAACAGCLAAHVFELWPCPTMQAIGEVLK